MYKDSDFVFSVGDPRQPPHTILEYLDFIFRVCKEVIIILYRKVEGGERIFSNMRYLSSIPRANVPSSSQRCHFSECHLVIEHFVREIIKKLFSKQQINSNAMFQTLLGLNKKTSGKPTSKVFVFCCVKV